MLGPLFHLSSRSCFWSLQCFPVVLVVFTVLLRDEPQSPAGRRQEALDPIRSGGGRAHPLSHAQCLLDRPAGRHLGPERGWGRKQVTRCGGLTSAGGALGHAESLTLTGSGQKMLVAAPSVASHTSFGYFHWVRRNKPHGFWLRVFVADSWDTV